MNIYLAYRFAGEDFDILSSELASITKILEQTGHSVYYSVQKEDYFISNHFTNKQILKYSLSELEKSDALLAYIKSPEKSEGMLLEIGYALAKQKQIFIAIREGIQTGFVTELADKVINFDELSDLMIKIEKHV